MAEKLKRYRVWREAAGGAILVLAIFIAACAQPPEPVGKGCGWSMAKGDTTTGLGMSDFNASYMGALMPVKVGVTLKVRGEFPHSRYASFVLYDQDFMLIDSIRDYEIVPSQGVNPFLPGADRGPKYLGEYELTVVSDPPPKSGRAKNTLYAGLDHQGKPNRMAVLAYRVYLPDRGLGFRDHNPSAMFGGVEPQEVQFYKAQGLPFCPGSAFKRMGMGRVMGSILRANQEMMADPMKALGGLSNPPLWYNNASDLEQRDNTLVPNDDTRYIAAPVLSKFGELLVLRWKPVNTPVETYDGKPFPAKSDMRYWSVSFAYIDRSKPLVVYTEKTLADVDLPRLPDGTSRLVVGFGGMDRPDFVPAGQWVGLKLKEGFVIARNILIRPDFPGQFGKIPRGKIPPEYDQYTPGGVYCSKEELKQNPDLGLSRPQPPAGGK